MSCTLYSSLFYPSHRPHLSVCSLYVFGVTYIYTHHTPNAHTSPSTPHILYHKYLIKCVYGCACLKPHPPSSSSSSSSLLSMQSRFFFLQTSLLACFCQATPIKMLFHLLSSTVSKGVAHFQLKQKRSFKIQSKMSVLLLTDLSLSKGHKLFLQAWRSGVNHFSWSFYSALWGVEGHSSWIKYCQTVWIFQE